MNVNYYSSYLKQRETNNKKALLVEVIATIAIAAFVMATTYSNLTGQAERYTSEVTTGYNMVIDKYVRSFNTVYCQLRDKLSTNPSFEELDAWLKSNEETWKDAMGKDSYDGIAISYKNGYARSWYRGDYSKYDPKTREWYKVSEQAQGKTAVLAPYITFLDSQSSDEEPYILMSVVKQYAPGINIDYDFKLPEIKALTEQKKSRYKDTKVLLVDEKGYVLSSSDKKYYAHNIKKTDQVITTSFSQTLQEAIKNPDQLHLTVVNQTPVYLYVNKDDNNNYTCVFVNFFMVVWKDYALIILVTICLFGFEIYFYKRNKRVVREYINRDARLRAITDASFERSMYIDLEEMSYHGNGKTSDFLKNTSNYKEFFIRLSKTAEGEGQEKAMVNFLSPSALIASCENLNTLQHQRFLLHWKMENGQRALRTIEISRMASEVEKHRTISLLFRDVTEDANILKNALNQAQSASKAKGDFMSRMSHEIRTPLNAIIGYLDIAKDEHNDKEKTEHCLNQAGIAAKHLLSIINDVLDISSIESGRMKIAYEDFDLTQVIHALTAIFYAQAKQKRIDFNVKVEGLTHEWVQGDALRVNQILLNLLSNAIKFTPPEGKITLKIAQMGVRDGKVHMQFMVSDTGIGMSEEYKERMFTPFEQESAATAQKFGGTGLGLSICHNLVKIMGGAISVESKLGEGTTFVVSLAFGESVENAKEHATTDSFAHLRALVVDDEESALEYTKRLFDRCGVKCDAVNSGKKALRRIKSRQEEGNAYDIVIVDWNMPELNGVETAREIQKLAHGKLPIIIATAYDFADIEEDAKKAGVQQIVSKPLFQSTMFNLLVNTYGKYAPKEEIKHEPINFKGMKVLLAEDNAMNMEIAKEILTKAGMVVTPVVNGKEALDTFVHSQPGTFEAILMDIQMPIMDGYEATRAIRKSEHEQAKTIPIVAMTANAFTSDVTAALDAGMNDHIAKPVSYEQLFATLTRLTTKTME